MKILFKEYLNKLIYLRNSRENFLFFLSFSIIYNMFILKNVMIIKIISSFFNTTTLIFIFSLIITTLLNLRTYSSYLNPFIRNALEIKTKKAFYFHYLKLLFLQLIFTTVIIFQVSYSLKNIYSIFLFLLINPLLVTMSMKNIKTLVTFVLSNIIFLILFVNNVNQLYVLVISLIIIFFNFLVFTKSIKKEQKGENKILWLPKNLFFETFILTIRQSKLKLLLISFCILFIFYFIFPYNKQFDIFEWLSIQTNFKNTSTFHMPLLFILLLSMTYLIQFNIFSTTFDKDKMYSQSNKFIVLHKIVIVFFLLIFTYIVQYLVMLHMDSENIKNMWNDYSKMQQIKGLGLSLYLVPSFVLSLLSVVKFKLNKTIKFFIYCFVIYLPFNEFVVIIINYDPYSIITLLCIMLTTIIIYKQLLRKKKNEMNT